jgi:DUF1707 SHOCT-like domain
MRRATLRASDQDREHVADRLRHAAGEGRLLAEELEERMGSAFAARTYGQLDALVADLPAPRESASHTFSLWVRAGFGLALVVAALLAVALAALIIIGLARAGAVWIFLVWAVWGRGRRHHHRPVRPVPPGRRAYLR